MTETIQNTVNTSTHIAKIPTHYKTHTSHTHTLQNPDIHTTTHYKTHTSTHYKTHTYTHPHITKPTHTHIHTLQNKLKQPQNKIYTKKIKYDIHGLLKHVTDGKIGDTGRRGRRHKQLLDDLKDMRM